MKLENQIELAKRDAKKEVGKGSDIGLVAYTRVYLYVGGAILLFVYLSAKFGDMVPRGPMRLVFVVGMLYAFVKLLKSFDK